MLALASLSYLIHPLSKYQGPFSRKKRKEILLLAKRRKKTGKEEEVFSSTKIPDLWIFFYLSLSLSPLIQLIVSDPPPPLLFSLFLLFVRCPPPPPSAFLFGTKLAVPLISAGEYGIFQYSIKQAEFRNLCLKKGCKVPFEKECLDSKTDFRRPSSLQISASSLLPLLFSCGKAVRSQNGGSCFCCFCCCGATSFSCLCSQWSFFPL